jgi:hypothetical protein
MSKSLVEENKTSKIIPCDKKNVVPPGIDFDGYLNLRVDQSTDSIENSVGVNDRHLEY